MDFEKRKFLHNVTSLKYIAAYRDPSLTSSRTRLISHMHGDSDMDRVWIIFLHIVTACPNSNCICVLHLKDGRCPRGIACGIVNGVLATFVDIAANSIGFRSPTKQKLEEEREASVKIKWKIKCSWKWKLNVRISKTKTESAILGPKVFPKLLHFGKIPRKIGQI